MLQQHQTSSSSSQWVEAESSRAKDAFAPVPVITSRHASPGVVHRAPMAHRCKHRTPRSYFTAAHATDEGENVASVAERAAV